MNKIFWIFLSFVARQALLGINKLLGKIGYEIKPIQHAPYEGDLFSRKGRIEDVIALIQLLGTKEKNTLNVAAIQNHLNRPPKSGTDWLSVINEHDEFFITARCKNETHVGLIFRHWDSDDLQANASRYESVCKLIYAAIDIHDRQIRRNEKWIVLIPVWAAIIAFIPALIAIIIRIK